MQRLALIDEERVSRHSSRTTSDGLSTITSHVKSLSIPIHSSRVSIWACLREGFYFKTPGSNSI